MPRQDNNSREEGSLIFSPLQRRIIRSYSTRQPRRKGRARNAIAHTRTLDSSRRVREGAKSQEGRGRFRPVECDLREGKTGKIKTKERFIDWEQLA